jgi:hypothetical protein
LAVALRWAGRACSVRPRGAVRPRAAQQGGGAHGGAFRRQYAEEKEEKEHYAAVCTRYAEEKE